MRPTATTSSRRSWDEDVSFEFSGYFAHIPPMVDRAGETYVPEPLGEGCQNLAAVAATLGR